MKAKIALKLVEWTSLPLLLFAGLMVMSGYGLTSEAVRTASLGLLTFSSSQTIHLGRLARLGFTAILFTHSYAGTVILAQKLRLRGRKGLASLIEYGVIAFLIYTGWVVLNGEMGG